MEWTDAGLAPARTHRELRSSGPWRPFETLPWLRIPVIGGTATSSTTASCKPLSIMSPSRHLPWQYFAAQRVGLGSRLSHFLSVTPACSPSLSWWPTAAIDLTGSQAPGASLKPLSGLGGCHATRRLKWPYPTLALPVLVLTWRRLPWRRTWRLPPLGCALPPPWRARSARHSAWSARACPGNANKLAALGINCSAMDPPSCSKETCQGMHRAVLAP